MPEILNQLEGPVIVMTRKRTATGTTLALDQTLAARTRHGTCPKACPRLTGDEPA